MREEAKIEMMALEEQLALMDKDKADLLSELAAMKAILQATEDDKSKKKKKKERLVYQLSCRKCNKQMNFVGTTEHDLKTTMKKHFDEVVKATKKPSKRRTIDSLGSGGDHDNDDKSVEHKKEAWHAVFAEHFAKHCRPRIGFKSVSERDVIKFCREHVKVEVLRRSDGAELYWEDTE